MLDEGDLTSSDGVEQRRARGKGASFVFRCRKRELEGEAAKKEKMERRERESFRVELLFSSRLRSPLSSSFFQERKQKLSLFPSPHPAHCSLSPLPRAENAHARGEQGSHAASEAILPSRRRRRSREQQQQQLRRDGRRGVGVDDDEHFSFFASSSSHAQPLAPARLGVSRRRPARRRTIFFPLRRVVRSGTGVRGKLRAQTGNSRPPTRFSSSPSFSETRRKTRPVRLAKQQRSKT
jgi:hypothetical protein